MKKILVAYSGGLDTSCILHWLRNKYKAKVYAYCADVAGLSRKEKSALIKKGLRTGAEKVIVEDLREEFLKDFVFPALKANAVYEGGYFLATALSRPLIAKHLVSTAKKYGIKTVSHGCTAKGNDQVRFETAVYSLACDIEVIAPLRFWELTTREQEVEYAGKNKIPVSAGSKKYSIDENIWGVAIECGQLEDTAMPPPDDAWQLTGGKVPKKESKISVSFKGGVPCGLNGKVLSSVELVGKLNDLGAQYGIGRSDIVESRVVGIKSREIYEAPAAEILTAAHTDLERLVLDKETLHYKEKLSHDFAELVYKGRWFSPLRTALTAFVESTQGGITGSVDVILRPYGFEIVSRFSPNSRYVRGLATYAEGDTFERELAEGFIKLSCLDIAKKK
ncbi:MAG: argininosuccinate synthase [bacterium]